MSNYAFDLNDKEALRAIKRLHPERKKQKLQTKNRIQSVFLNMNNSSPMNEKLERPFLRFSTTPVSFFIENTQYYLIDMKAQTTKYDTKNVDYFEYVLSDDELIRMIQAGLYRGDQQSFTNALNNAFVGEEFTLSNGVTYYSTEIDEISIIAYEDQDQSLNSRRIDSNDIQNLDAYKILQSVSVQRVLEQVRDKEVGRLAQVIIDKEIAFDEIESKKEKAQDEVNKNNLNTDISLDELVKEIKEKKEQQPYVDKTTGVQQSKVSGVNNMQQSGIDISEEKGVKEVEKDSRETVIVDNDEQVAFTQEEIEGKDTYSELEVKDNDFLNKLPPIEIDKEAGRVVYREEKDSLDEPEI